MAYKIEIRPLATIEIIEAYDWYELQREGLGIEFLMELEIFYTTLQRNPDTYYLLPKTCATRGLRQVSLHGCI
jgi:toxin ParE1/3/4